MRIPKIKIPRIKELPPGLKFVALVHGSYVALMLIGGVKFSFDPRARALTPVIFANAYFIAWLSSHLLCYENGVRMLLVAWGPIAAICIAIAGIQFFGETHPSKNQPSFHPSMLVVVFMILFCLWQSYYLMRRDVRALYRKETT